MATDRRFTLEPVDVSDLTAHEYLAYARAKWARQTARQTALYVRSVQLFQQAIRAQIRHYGPTGRPSLSGDGLSLPPSPPPRALIATSERRVDAERQADTSVGRAARPALVAVPASRTSGPLTQRQLEIAGLIAQGNSNEQIAELLVLTPGTVGNHVSHILRRLNVRNRAQVATWFTSLAREADANSA